MLVQEHILISLHGNWEPLLRVVWLVSSSAGLDWQYITFPFLFFIICYFNILSVCMLKIEFFFTYSCSLTVNVTFLATSEFVISLQSVRLDFYWSVRYRWTTIVFFCCFQGFVNVNFFLWPQIFLLMIIYNILPVYSSPIQTDNTFLCVFFQDFLFIFTVNVNFSCRLKILLTIKTLKCPSSHFISNFTQVSDSSKPQCSFLLFFKGSMSLFLS